MVVSHFSALDSLGRRREEFGVAPIVKLLEGQLGPAVTSAAADAVRAIALNNDANKTALREAWALPQLVKLLLPEVGGRYPADLIACSWCIPRLRG